MSNSQKQGPTGSKEEAKHSHQAKTSSQGHKTSNNNDLSAKSAPDNSGKTGSHKSKSS